MSSSSSSTSPFLQESELRYLTFLYTCPLTVLFGAEKSCSSPSQSEGWLRSRSSLTVHLIGARRAELRHLAGWEILACRLPVLKRLKLVFVGSEAADLPDLPREFTYKGKELQEKRKGIEVVYSFPPPTLYQVSSIKKQHFPGQTANRKNIPGGTCYERKKFKTKVRHSCGTVFK